MTKQEKMVNAVKEQIEVLFGYELTEKEMEKIEKIGSKKAPTEKDLETLQAMEDKVMKRSSVEGAEEVVKTDGKKVVFQWQAIEGYYKMKLQQVTSEKIKKGFKVSFRLDAKKIEKIDNYFYYNNKEKSDFSSLEFENGQDVCTVVSIGKDGIIKAVSDNNGGEWFIYPEDINGSKSTKCVLKDGSGIAFLVYAPNEKTK